MELQPLALKPPRARSLPRRSRAGSLRAGRTHASGHAARPWSDRGPPPRSRAAAGHLRSAVATLPPGPTAMTVVPPAVTALRGSEEARVQVTPPSRESHVPCVPTPTTVLPAVPIG